MRTRHVPERSCVICGTKTAKRDLVRVVMTPLGECRVDETGKLAGRGAYLCHRPECWHRAVTSDRLQHSLRHEVGAADRERLAEFGSSLVGEPAG